MKGRNGGVVYGRERKYGLKRQGTPDMASGKWKHFNSETGRQRRKIAK